MERYESCIPMPVECGMLIGHVAFNGRDYFATTRCRHEIVRFDLCRNTLRKYCTCREYDCICYDHCECCFWASEATCSSRLFKLDASMREIDYINICAEGVYGKITGISCNCCKDTLLVSMTSAVFEVQKQSEKTMVLCKLEEGWILDVLSVCPGMLITVFKENRYYIDAIDSRGKRTGRYGVDCTCIPKNLIFNPCTAGCWHEAIWLFGFKRGEYPYLCKTGISLEDMAIVPCCCNYEICKACSCDDGADPCEDIMESVALMEVVLAGILDAEGKKIKKVLETTDDVDKILCVNRQVNQTIMNVTHLEQILYAKLSALQDCALCEPFCEDCEAACGCAIPQEEP